MGDNHYQYALDSNGDVIYIDEASPDEDFFCLVCNLKVIPKDQNEE